MNVAFLYALARTILARPFILWNLALIICSSCQNKCFRQIEVLVRTPSSEKEVWKEPLRRWWGKESPLWQSMATRKHGKSDQKGAKSLWWHAQHSSAYFLSSGLFGINRQNQQTDRTHLIRFCFFNLQLVEVVLEAECYTLECHITAASD